VQSGNASAEWECECRVVMRVQSGNVSAQWECECRVGMYEVLLPGTDMCDD